jgi:hypothetical protein
MKKSPVEKWPELSRPNDAVCPSESLTVMLTVSALAGADSSDKVGCRSRPPAWLSQSSVVNYS